MCRTHWESLWDFRTKHYHVACEVTHDDDADLSWADQETLDDISEGRLTIYGMRVVVRKAGLEIAEDSLWGCVYKNPSEFVTEHRSADPMNRNCSIMREARGGNVVICHYFPDMVSQAIRHAREKLERLAA